MKRPKPEKRLPGWKEELEAGRERAAQRARFYEDIRPEWQDRLIAHCAMNGDFEPLIDALKLDDEIGPQTRAFLIRDFASGTPRKRGNKATVAQVQNDVQEFWQICCIMEREQVSKTRAMQIFASEANKNLETVKSMFKRTEPSLPEFVPQELDGRYRFPVGGSASKPKG